MNKGGYQIIDFKNRASTAEVSFVWPGTYKLIENARKPLLISGVNVSSYTYPDFFGVAYPGYVDEFVITSDELGIRISVKIDDTVTMEEF